ncbi:MAG: hypothetical protein IPL83_06245 [Bdellovibrionales bacterium]|nr:hypothetical protein [Bdellovibrionales bacterium]
MKVLLRFDVQLNFKESPISLADPLGLSSSWAKGAHVLGGAFPGLLPSPLDISLL